MASGQSESSGTYGSPEDTSHSQRLPVFGATLESLKAEPSRSKFSQPGKTGLTAYIKALTKYYKERPVNPCNATSFDNGWDKLGIILDRLERLAALNVETASIKKPQYLIDMDKSLTNHIERAKLLMSRIEPLKNQRPQTANDPSCFVNTNGLLASTPRDRLPVPESSKNVSRESDNATKSVNDEAPVDEEIIPDAEGQDLLKMINAKIDFLNSNQIRMSQMEKLINNLKEHLKTTSQKATSLESKVTHDRPPQARWMNKAPESYAAVLSLEADQDPNTIREQLRKQKIFPKIGVAPTISNNKNLFSVKLPDYTSREKFIAAAQELNLNFKQTTRRGPTIEIPDINNDVPKDKIIEEYLLPQNSRLAHMKKDNIRLLFVRNPTKPRTTDETRRKEVELYKKDRYNVVMAVTQQLYDEIKLNDMKLNIDDEVKRVYPFSGIKQCFRCLRVGHLSKDDKCPLKSEDKCICSNCAGDHKYSNCPNKEAEKKCHNCVRYNEKFNKTGVESDCRHNALDRNCPYLKRVTEKLNDGIQW